MKRIFNIAGPCFQTDHYMLPASERLEEIDGLIDDKQFFVIHAARQSGKTTLLLDMVNKLNASGEYYALYCSLETVQGIDDAEKGVPAIIKTIRKSVYYSTTFRDHVFFKGEDFSDWENGLERAFIDFSASLDKPLVIFFDEADCLSNSTLISFLRQLRSGYVNRGTIPFIHSLALVGMRDIRDYKAHIRDGRETLGSASPFNIVTESLTLRNFKRDEVESLLSQHTDSTDQIFSKKVMDSVYHYTQGQPWLVNAVAREIVVKILGNDYSRRIETDYVEQAVNTLILRRDVHIDSLLERLKEERVRKVIEPIILGEEKKWEPLQDDYQYVKDLGLIRDDKGAPEPANPIYGEVILRTLSYSTQQALQGEFYPFTVPRYLKDGKIDMNYLFKDFQAFWRENSEIWSERYQYKEAAPHLILQAFLQRVINGGGKILREMAAGKRRLDLCVIYEDYKYPVELKVCGGYRGRSREKVQTEGIEQTIRYMDLVGTNSGWLVIFDRDENLSWDDKIYSRKETIKDKTVYIIGG
ncbi:MAG: AAA-like domain-containing protein [Spirochaetota bacterium]|nr:AAA-like domain-containing protein [Spirochaetota bacterium]